MEDKIKKIHAAIQEGANLVFRDGCFWPGPLEVWDRPPHNQVFPINVKESQDEHDSCTESSDRW